LELATYSEKARQKKIAMGGYTTEKCVSTCQGGVHGRRERPGGVSAIAETGGLGGFNDRKESRGKRPMAKKEERGDERASCGKT